jgi:hypothetical protein
MLFRIIPRTCEFSQKFNLNQVFSNTLSLKTFLLIIQQLTDWPSKKWQYFHFGTYDVNKEIKSIKDNLYLSDIIIIPHTVYLLSHS